VYGPLGRPAKNRRGNDGEENDVMHPDFMAMMIRERQRELEASMRGGYPRSTAMRARRASQRSAQPFQMAYKAFAKLCSQPPNLSRRQS
jgi:hypothetical protein